MYNSEKTVQLFALHFRN